MNNDSLLITFYFIITLIMITFSSVVILERLDKIEQKITHE